MGLGYLGVALLRRAQQRKNLLLAVDRRAEVVVSARHFAWQAIDEGSSSRRGEGVPGVGGVSIFRPGGGGMEGARKRALDVSNVVGL